jgi:hypothetical protein
LQKLLDSAILSSDQALNNIVKTTSLFVFVTALVALLATSDRHLPTPDPVLRGGGFTSVDTSLIRKIDPLAMRMQRAVLKDQDLGEIQRILDAGFHIDDPIGCGTFNSVDGAVAVGNVKMLKFLLENGAQAKSGALIQSVWCKNPDVSYQLVATLLKAGADAGYKDYYQEPWITGDTHVPVGKSRFNTPLHVACYQGYSDVAALLLTHRGVELNVLDIDGYTPLMWAASKGNEKIVGLLLANGANPKLQNGRGETAVSLARRQSGDRSKLVAMLTGAPRRPELSVAAPVSINHPPPLPPPAPAD